MKFPGKRKNKHYFPVTEKGRIEFNHDFVHQESFHVVGIDQLLVDIEFHVDDDFLTKWNLNKGQSQIMGDDISETIYWQLKNEKRIAGEFAGGTVGNTLHNYSTLSEERSVALGAITKFITVGDYAFKYICSTSAKVDLTYLQPCDNKMGRAMCFVTPDGERTFGISKGCMNDLSPEYIPTVIIEKASSLLICAYVLRDEKAPIFHSTIKACEVAKSAGVPVVLTLGTSDLIKEKRDFFVEFIQKYVNVVAMNDAESLALTGMDDSLLALEKTLEITDMALLTVGASGLYMGGWVDESVARMTDHELHTKSIIEYNKYEYSRGMRRDSCVKPIKIYSHINPFLGGPMVIKNTNGAGDGALAALLHDMGANNYHRIKVPNSPKHSAKYLTYSSFSQICKYANRVSFEVLNQNSPRLMKGLPEKEESLQEAYWDA
ncbi:MAG: inosine/guanosine kinase [Bacteriovoracaceae bacterium]